MARTKTQTLPPADMPEILPAAAHAVADAQLAATQAEQAAHALATQLGYEGALTVGALEDEIRFYQRRSVEALLECGKRLLLLKEMTPHGEFTRRVEMLGFSERTARRFMQAAVKVSKSATVAVLAGQVKNAKAFLELVTHDSDEDIERVAELDEIDSMSASELRAALREAKKEADTQQELVNTKNARIDKLERDLQRIKRLPPDEAAQKVREEAGRILADVLAGIKGDLRHALQALGGEGGEKGANAIFAAGLVGQIGAELARLREEFNLPDVSHASSTLADGARKAIREGVAELRAQSAGGAA